MGQVRIGTCRDTVDSAFVRSMLEARGIRCVIGAESHASLLGPIHGAFLSLDIWVAEDDAEDASALLREVRDTKVEDAPDPRDAMDPDDEAALEGDGEWVARAHALTGTARDEQDAQDHALARSERAELDAMRGRSFYKNRARLGVLASVIPSLGLGHLITGAPLRGLVLAAIEILGIMHRAAGDHLGTLAIAGAITADLVGTVWRMRNKGYL